MIKGLNYKLVNALLLILIIYLIYQTRNFWFGVVSILCDILLPFFIAFLISYALTPIVSFFRGKGLSKRLSIFLVLMFVVFIFGFLLYLATPIFLEQITNVFDGIISFVKEISLKYSINFNDAQDELSNMFNRVLEKIGPYISNGMINIIGVSISFISKFFIASASLVYFLNDMDKIKDKIKCFFIKYNKRFYYYLSFVNKELQNYLQGFAKIIFISFFEYTLLYFVIGHPNYLMLGFLASIGNLIPYFGGIITNIIAAMTAFVINPELFIRTCAIFVIFSIVDGYLINPLVYGKTNKLHPILIIISVFAGGILFGFMGIIVSLPILIIIVATYNFFKIDIEKIIKQKIKKLRK